MRCPCRPSGFERPANATPTPGQSDDEGRSARQVLGKVQIICVRRSEPTELFPCQALRTQALFTASAAISRASSV